MKRNTKKTPSIAEALLAAGTSRRRGWDFTAEQRAAIDECLAVNASGRGYIAALPLARALKERFDLPWSIGGIRAKLAALAPGGRWT